MVVVVDHWWWSIGDEFSVSSPGSSDLDVGGDPLVVRVDVQHHLGRRGGGEERRKGRRRKEKEGEGRDGRKGEVEKGRRRRDVADLLGGLVEDL